ncbi:transmembrane protein, putative (macronuclear) [Tetrahymena thermophila SB210]|uniref:Transmembrane protein, putative n=1 Tax=Tetrahymena thermophila (strain SB210) TaxID=312017 RepID=W7X459_TETTS|nr:transmembrane protein, putative [Tetrahymena thermophila SB210]EWS74100.1 transmembrane protein, putative [Tetrahymena thermophila SB210]|eukprot:XP_012653355.1 transmembrane protein, putative [Tetrahymena thermophila SB210]
MVQKLVQKTQVINLLIKCGEKNGYSTVLTSYFLFILNHIIASLNIGIHQEVHKVVQHLSQLLLCFFILRFQLILDLKAFYLILFSKHHLILIANLQFRIYQVVFISNDFHSNFSIFFIQFFFIFFNFIFSFIFHFSQFFIFLNLFLFFKSFFYFFYHFLIFLF